MDHVLNELYATLLERKSATAEKSYVASLYQKGTAHICDKVIEEAAETIEEALKADPERLKEESADLLFHLMVLWADQGISSDDVMQVLAGRMGISGHEEKAGRTKED